MLKNQQPIAEATQKLVNAAEIAEQTNKTLTSVCNTGTKVIDKLNNTINNSIEKIEKDMKFKTDEINIYFKKRFGGYIRWEYIVALVLILATTSLFAYNTLEIKSNTELIPNIKSTTQTTMKAVTTTGNMGYKEENWRYSIFPTSEFGYDKVKKFADEQHKK